MNHSKRLFEQWEKIGAFILIAFIVLIMLFPFYIVFLNAFKTPVDYAQRGPLVWPSPFSFQGISNFWLRVDFTNKLMNSFSISLAVAIIAVGISLLNAYALGIGRIKGRTILLVLFVVANTLPHEALVYPLYYLAKLLKIYDRQIAVILVFSVIQSAFGTYLLSSVYASFPRELLEAAEVDGCTKTTTLFHIVAPISMPTLSVLFTFFFIWTWNEFFLPLILLISNNRQTVPIAISVTQGQHNMDATMASASALLGILPCLIFFFIFQRTLTKGITAGSLK
ncbi:carbohydrate ABC transporter permease [Gracilinema caldarium]|uniref:sn-glycerol-3-phosphate transport system permease protein UgpE n=1 Tax=Gracilinema caldarium (strain ATCC 51460 / DSM 7334 / H1) TaxID=744872 RepID=F8EYU6_GRAC1|nr:carbohydrate ABC transporter permease [Gracilinema caldarium]AEJ18892.1 ABC-type transporter, integral membrane subunit [Gracilinema caldarium DSM 7334]